MDLIRIEFDQLEISIYIYKKKKVARVLLSYFKQNMGNLVKGYKRRLWKKI